MNIFLITDTHFYHDKMVQYCDRPENFSDLIGTQLFLLCNNPDDVLIHLGDICVGRDEEAHREFIEPLQCKKWLIRGNHDTKSNTWYLSHGWDWVGFMFQDRFFGKNILFSHTPMRYQEIQSSLYGTESFDINVHGHFHNNLHRLLEKKWATPDEEERNRVDLSNLTPKHKLLAIENTGYHPVLLDKFLNL